MDPHEEEAVLHRLTAGLKEEKPSSSQARNTLNPLKNI